MATRTEKRQRLFELAATQAGYFTAGQARGLGYSTRSLVYHAQSGHFERVGRGFYRLTEFPGLPNEDVIAAWAKVGPERAVISHDTALALYELAQSRSHEIHLTVPREHRPRQRSRGRRGVKIHTTLQPLSPIEVVQRFGARVTSPARTIADAAEIGTDPSIVVEAVGRALRTGLLTADELHRAARARSSRVKELIRRAIEEAARRAPVR
ncbi:MAG TPA: type IV toxin-antitoxin system AbiEi family antitoxin domain-containing protein [bacterium]|nr:type IV toxin-antitoxin system AbiEi family antitoxin domain-containing protein [bacterium]